MSELGDLASAAHRGQLLLAAAPRKMADAPLSDAGEAQLLEVARSLQRRRLRAVAEVVSEFKEAKEDRLTEELYTHEDAERLLDGLLGLVRTSVKNDVRASEHSTLLLLNDALAQAARGGAGVAVDPARCADRALLQAVDQWETRDGAQPLRQRMAEKKAAFVAPSQARAARPPFRPHPRLRVTAAPGALITTGGNRTPVRRPAGHPHRALTAHRNYRARRWAWRRTRLLSPPCSPHAPRTPPSRPSSVPCRWRW